VRQLVAAFLPASLLTETSMGSAIARQQAGSRQSGSKLPHSKALHRMTGVTKSCVLAVDMLSGNVQEFKLLLALERGFPVSIDGNG
jgi:hypothetical protein